MHQKNAKISVIIPVYNVEKYLQECIDSVINQNLDNIEIILVNDGSTDGSSDICREYACRCDNIVLLEKENGGLSSARNAGLDAASGKYIYFLDSDDYISQDCLKRLYECAEAERLDILLFSAVSFLDEDGREWQPPVYQKTGPYPMGISGKELFSLLYLNGEYTSSVPQYISRKNWIRSCGFRFADGYLHEDEIYTFMALQSAKRAGVLCECFYHRRCREGSITQSNIRFDRFKGYAYVCSEMIRFCSGQIYTPEQKKAVEGYILQTFKTTVLTKIELKEKEKQRYKEIIISLQKEMKTIQCCHTLEGYILCYWLTGYRCYMRIKKNVTFRKCNP